MFSEDLNTEDKLLILLALETYGMPITDMYLTELLLSPGYMNYFSIHDALGKLVSNNLVDRVLDNEGIPMYSINQAGKDVFTEFGYLLPDGLATKYENHIMKSRNEIKKKIEVNYSVSSDADGNYFARLFVRDGSNYVVDIKVPAAGSDDANNMCRRWKENNSEMYLKIMEALHL